MSNFILNGIAFDYWSGVVKLPTRRVAVFSPADRAFVGAQVFPLTGEAFTIKTTLFSDANLRTANSVALSGLIGRTVPIIHNSLDYASTYRVRFLVVNVVHESIDVIVAHHGHRNGQLVTLEPAGRVVTTWSLQAIPAS
jgi:hypothetical protein